MKARASQCLSARARRVRLSFSRRARPSRSQDVARLTVFCFHVERRRSIRHSCHIRLSHSTRRNVSGRQRLSLWCPGQAEVTSGWPRRAASCTSHRGHRALVRLRRTNGQALIEKQASEHVETPPSVAEEKHDEEEVLRLWPYCSNTLGCTPTCATSPVSREKLRSSNLKKEKERVCFPRTSASATLLGLHARSGTRKGPEASRLLSVRPGSITEEAESASGTPNAEL